LAISHQSTIYKICRPDEWAGTERAGVFRGSPDDKRDGFIHFSTAAQIPETVEKYFAGESDLVLVAVDAAKLGASIEMGTVPRWRVVPAPLWRFVADRRALEPCAGLDHRFQTAGAITADLRVGNRERS